MRTTEKVHTGHHKGAAHTQWTLWGEWTQEEIEIIEALFKEHMSPCSAYPWIVFKYRGFSARRAFWDASSFTLTGNTLQELMDAIHHYYETYEGI